MPESKLFPSMYSFLVFHSKSRHIWDFVLETVGKGISFQKRKLLWKGFPINFVCTTNLSRNFFSPINFNCPETCLKSSSDMDFEIWVWVKCARTHILFTKLNSYMLGHIKWLAFTKIRLLLQDRAQAKWKLPQPCKNIFIKVQLVFH